jgi:hypothetical protein
MMVKRKEPFRFDITRDRRGISVKADFSIYDNSEYVLLESHDFITWRIRGHANKAGITRYDRNSLQQNQSLFYRLEVSPTNTQ